MQAQEIEHYLAELGVALQDQGINKPVRLLLIGGAYCGNQLYQNKYELHEWLQKARSKGRHERSARHLALRPAERNGSA